VIDDHARSFDMRLRSIDVGIFAFSFAMLLLEILLTRVFSVAMYHHFSFLAVSVAMTGLAVGGIIVNLFLRTFRAQRLHAVAPALSVAFAVSARLLRSVRHAERHGSLCSRPSASAFVAPMAFVMGMPLPTGLRHAGRESRSLVSWGWAVNGGCSVFGSVLAVVVSMSAGFSSSLWVAAGAYLAALNLALALCATAETQVERGAGRAP
jgi:hypothetical protein